MGMLELPIDENKSRADSVVAPIAQFINERGLQSEDLETIVGDFITNLCHFMRVNEIHPAIKLQIGLDNFGEELAEEAGFCSACGDLCDEAFEDGVPQNLFQEGFDHLGSLCRLCTETAIHENQLTPMTIQREVDFLTS